MFVNWFFLGRGRWSSVGGGVREGGVDVAGDVTLEATDDLALGAAFGEAAGDVFAGALVGAHAADADHVDGAVAWRLQRG